MSNQDLNIYSPEKIGTIISDSFGENGEFLTTISVKRGNRYSKIYMNYNSGGDVIPTVFRSYWKGDQLVRHSKTYPILLKNDHPNPPKQVEFEYDMLNDYNYITYFISFEVIATSGAFITIDEIGVIFDDILATSNRTDDYSTSLIRDINNTPTSRQNYTKKVGYTLITNRSNVQEIINVLEKPYYLVNRFYGKELVDKYAFKFNGDTGITSYKTCIFSEGSFTIYFEMKYNIDSENGAFLFGVLPQTNDYTRILIRTNTLGELSFGAMIASNVTINLACERLFMQNGEVYKVIITGAPNPTDPQEYIIDASIDGIHNFSGDDRGAYSPLGMITRGDPLHINFGGLYNHSTHTKNSLANFTIWDETKTVEEQTGLLSAFSSDGAIFYESFNNFPKGDVIGVEQYEIIGQTENDVICLDNSTKLLSAENPSIKYIGNATKMIEFTINGTEQI